MEPAVPGRPSLKRSRPLAAAVVCFALAAPVGSAHAFTPGPHWDAVEKGLAKSNIQPGTLGMIWHGDDASDKRPYWSDGQAHCDGIDHFGYQHEYRVRDFGPEGDYRPDTPEEERDSKGYYHDFQSSRAARQAADLQLLGCVQYAFDRINLAVHLARNLVSDAGKRNPATWRDARCREVPGQRYGGQDPDHPEWGHYWFPSWNDETRLWRDYYKTEPFFTDELKPNPKCNVIEQFGRGLHAIQDFYAHSNWADSEITTDTEDFTYSKKIGTWANPKGLKHTTPFPLFDFDHLDVPSVDYNAIDNAARQEPAPWRYLPPRLAYKQASGLRGPSGTRPFYLERFDQFRRQYLAAHRGRYPLSEPQYKDLQSGCYTEQTIIGNRICREDQRLGHYSHIRNERWYRDQNGVWHVYERFMSGGVGGLAKDTLTGTTDRAAADLKTGKLPKNRKDARAKAKSSSFTNAVNVAAKDTERQWKYFTRRLTDVYGPRRAEQMLRIITEDQAGS